MILTIVDRFSKASHFVSLQKLPSAVETGELLLRHVFRLHGLPWDILSNRGTQITARTWLNFGLVLGATVSLFLGDHPQSNGQTERANQILESILQCVWQLSIWGPRALSSLGLSTPKTPKFLPPLECRLSWPPWAFCHPCSLGRSLCFWSGPTFLISAFDLHWILDVQRWGCGCSMSWNESAKVQRSGPGCLNASWTRDCSRTSTGLTCSLGGLMRPRCSSL